MGMVAYFRHLAPEKLEQLKQHPELIRPYLYPEENEPAVMQMQTEGRMGVFSAEAFTRAVQEGNEALEALSTAQQKIEMEILRHSPAAIATLRRKYPELAADLGLDTGPIPPVADDDSDPMDIDKSWQGIHYLLTGTPWGGTDALAKAILGGTEIGPDVGYGPARYLAAEEVQEINAALSEVTTHDLVKRWDVDKMQKAEIYCVGNDDGLEYCLEYFRELVGYYNDAAQKGHAMLLYMA
jgi:hypothetical protein